MGKISDAVKSYHESTKHLPQRYARGPMGLDWASQPAPFRRYVGARTVQLPLIKDDPVAGYEALYEPTQEPRPFTLENVAAFLELSMGLSAWKSFEESTWALRMNPSSGNLHPTEVHLLLPPLPEDGLSAGVFHYEPYAHEIEERAEIPKETFAELTGETGGFCVALSSIFWREAWKYGERAFRYCCLDAGHAAAAMRFAASLLGWRVTYLSALSDPQIETMLGFGKTAWKELEREVPEAMFMVKSHTAERVGVIPGGVIKTFETLEFIGTPNPLSTDHVNWEAIEGVSKSTEKPGTVPEPCRFKDEPYFDGPAPSLTGAEIIRSRRSGQAYDGKTPMGSGDFFALLDRTIPREGRAPFDIGVGASELNLLIFVNMVDGLSPGLYYLIRNGAPLEEVKAMSHREFLWQRVEGVSEEVPLYLLYEGELRRDAARLSCAQDIAGDGCFSLGMIARYRENIEGRPWSYRSLYWEAGLVGQVLYLEAEARGLRGTGIGCFYDDLVHEFLSLSDDTYQSIYHFTIGQSLEDLRLKTLPPYHHLKR